MDDIVILLIAILNFVLSGMHKSKHTNTLKREREREKKKHVWGREMKVKRVKISVSYYM